jgi:hypothetical protein
MSGPQRATKLCAGCGIILDRDAAVCPRCRTVQPDAPPGTTPDAMPAPGVRTRTSSRRYAEVPRGGVAAQGGAHPATTDSWGEYATEAPSHRKLLVAFILAFFLPLTGVHRFYVGRIGTGILQLLTVGGCGVWWLIDLVKILSGTFEDDEGRRVSEWT